MISTFVSWHLVNINIKLELIIVNMMKNTVKTLKYSLSDFSNILGAEPNPEIFTADLAYLSKKPVFTIGQVY